MQRDLGKLFAIGVDHPQVRVFNISGKDVPTEWHDRTNKLSSFHMARASPERRYGEL